MQVLLQLCCTMQVLLQVCCNMPVLLQLCCKMQVSLQCCCKMQVSLQVCCKMQISTPKSPRRQVVLAELLYGLSVFRRRSQKCVELFFWIASRESKSTASAAHAIYNYFCRCNFSMLFKQFFQFVVSVRPWQVSNIDIIAHFSYPAPSPRQGSRKSCS